MVLPEVAQVPVALVLHETDHLLVWEGRAGGRCLGTWLRASTQQGPGQVGEGAGQGRVAGASPEK